MKTLFENQYALVQFDENQRIIKSSWLVGNADVTESEIKEMFTLGADLVRQYKPLYYWADERNREFVFEVHLQSWLANTLYGAFIQVGIKKHAIVMSHDLIISLSTEQAVNEAPVLPFEVKYFENEQDALQWLLS